MLDNFFNLYPNVQKFRSVKSFEGIYKFLNEPISIHRMVEACRFNRPALEGVVTELEAEFGNRTDLDLTDNFTKQSVGLLIKYILYDFGYITTIQKDIPKNKGLYFRSAMHYKFEDGIAKKKLVIDYKIESVL